jgi:hypothetical protein
MPVSSQNASWGLVWQTGEKQFPATFTSWESIKFLIWQRERDPRTGLLYLRGFVLTKKREYIGSVKNRLPAEVHVLRHAVAAEVARPRVEGPIFTGSYERKSMYVGINRMLDAMLFTGYPGQSKGLSVKRVREGPPPAGRAGRNDTPSRHSSRKPPWSVGGVTPH